MSRRDWWLVGAGVNAMGAFVGAITGSLFLVIWNCAWLGVSVFVLSKLKGE